MNELPLSSLIAFTLICGGYLVFMGLVIKWVIKLAIEVIKHW